MKLSVRLPPLPVDRFAAPLARLEAEARGRLYARLRATADLAATQDIPREDASPVTATSNQLQT